MTIWHTFADEAGNFDFSRKQSASLYFVLCTVTIDTCAVGDALLALRRELAWEGHNRDTVFHATEDPQAVRNAVFELLGGQNFRVDATIFEKYKAQPHLQSEQGLYKMAWYQHFKYIAPRIAKRGDRFFVAASSLGTKSARRDFHAAVIDVVEQVTLSTEHCVVAWPTSSDPCLQVADYCTWAIQRKWERQDERSYALIAAKIHSEYDIWQRGQDEYY
jgi:Protein of unknown function (DUF3800)